MDFSRKTDSLQFISNYIMKSGARFVVRDKKQRNYLIRNWMERFQTIGISDEERAILTERVLLNVWYLFPYILKPKKLPVRIFEEALQNMAQLTLKAMRKYKPEKNVHFTYYITKYMKEALSLTMREDTIVHTPSKVRHQQVADMLEDGCGIDTQQKPDVADGEDSSQPKEIDLYSLSFGPEHGTSAYTEDQDFSENNNAPRYELIEDTIFSGELRNYLEVALMPDSGVLNDRERLVISYRYGVFGAPRLTLAEVAEMFALRDWGGTKPWVHMIEQKAKAKLLDYFEEHCGVFGEHISEWIDRA